MRSLKSGNYLVIQSFMVDRLHLKGNELIVYAIIYGFSQNENQCYNGSLRYLCSWSSSTKQAIQNNLKSLLSKNLISKRVNFINGVKCCEYRINDLIGMQESCIPHTSEFTTPMQESCIPYARKLYTPMQESCIPYARKLYTPMQESCPNILNDNLVYKNEDNTFIKFGLSKNMSINEFRDYLKNDIKLDVSVRFARLLKFYATRLKCV